MSERVNIWRLRSKRPTVLLLAVLGSMLLLLTYQLWLGYRDQLRTAEINVRNLSSLFDTRLGATLQHVDANLLGLIRVTPAAALNQLSSHLYEQEINVSLDSRLFNVEGLAGYRIHDANGDSLYATDSAPTPQINIADRPYFQLLRSAPDAGLVFSDVLTGRPTVVMARAIRDGQGRFLGVVCGLLDMDYYTKQFQSLELGPYGLVLLRRSDTGASLIVWPASSDLAHRALDPNDPIAERLAAGEKSFVVNYQSPQDSVVRIIGVHALAHYPFYFMVALDKSDVLADWRSQAMMASAMALLLLLLVSVVVGRLGRMRAREVGILTTLAISESQFDSLAQRLPVGISRFDGNGRYTYVNDRLLAMTGRSRTEFLGSSWTDLIHPDDRTRLQKSWAFVGERPPPSLFECRFIRPDGQVVPVAGEVQPETAQDGAILGYTVAQIDISARKQVEAELRTAKQQAETANMAKTRFLAAASHDLRQPIQAINLFRDALERTELSTEQKTITQFLSLSVNSLGDLLYSLLDMSKIDAGLVKPQMKEVLVESLFQALDADFSTLARERNLRFKLFYPLKDMVLLTDPVLLRSVLRNLVDNAFKYTEQGGVLVGVRKRRGRCVIQVWDTGIGIDPRYGDQIFDECFQVGNHLRDRAKGLGIGLSIARRLSRLLMGDVTFRSRPGVGSVFEVVLPLADQQLPVVGALQAEVEATAGLDAFDPFVRPRVLPDRSERTRIFANDESGEERYSRLEGWRIVVVEDDPVVAKSIEISLQACGMQVLVFPDAELALAWPEIMAADFYISDLVLPGQNGLQLLDAIQQRDNSPINAVLMTGETAPGRVGHIKTASRWPVLIKPADLSKLLDIMNTVASK